MYRVHFMDGTPPRHMDDFLIIEKGKWVSAVDNGTHNKEYIPAARIQRVVDLGASLGGNKKLS